MTNTKKHINLSELGTWSIKHSRLLLVVVVVLVLFDISPFGGNIRFYSKWVQCGHKPVVAGMTYETVVPHYVESDALPGIRLSPAQFCSPHDAEMHGYSASPDRYDSPSLSQAEYMQVYDNYLCGGCGGPK